MPAFDKFAYSDGRCYGKKLADLKSYPTRMPDPPATLQQREIELVADFLLAKVVGKGPMDHAKCVEFWGSKAHACQGVPRNKPGAKLIQRKDEEVAGILKSCRISPDAGCRPLVCTARYQLGSDRIGNGRALQRRAHVESPQFFERLVVIGHHPAVL